MQKKYPTGKSANVVEDWYYATTPRTQDLEASTVVSPIGTSPRKSSVPQRKRSDHHQEVVAKLVDAGKRG